MGDTLEHRVALRPGSLTGLARVRTHHQFVRVPQDHGLDGGPRDEGT